MNLSPFAHKSENAETGGRYSHGAPITSTFPKPWLRSELARLSEYTQSGLRLKFYNRGVTASHGSSS